MLGDSLLINILFSLVYGPRQKKINTIGKRGEEEEYIIGRGGEEEEYIIETLLASSIVPYLNAFRASAAPIALLPPPRLIVRILVFIVAFCGPFFHIFSDKRNSEEDEAKNRDIQRPLWFHSDRSIYCELVTHNYMGLTLKPDEIVKL